MEDLYKEVSNFKIPLWEELPNINLYMDQVLNYLEDNLKVYISEEKDDKIITKTMINNYVKQGVIESPVNKKYSKMQIAELFVICVLKQVYSINDIKKLIDLALKTSPVDISYNKFCNVLHESIKTTFSGTEYSEPRTLTKEQYILKCVVQSVVNKLYTQIVYLKK